MELIQVIQEYGPLAGVVIFFLWRDFKREDRLLSRVEKLEDEQREIILPLVQKSTDVIARNTEVMERLERTFEKVNDDAHQRQP